MVLEYFPLPNKAALARTLRDEEEAPAQGSGPAQSEPVRLSLPASLGISDLSPRHLAPGMVRLHTA